MAKKLWQYFNGTVADDEHTIKEILAGDDWHIRLRRLKTVLTGKYYIRLGDKYNRIIAITDEFNTEAESIEAYNSIVAAIGKEHEPSFIRPNSRIDWRIWERIGFMDWAEEMAELFEKLADEASW